LAVRNQLAIESNNDDDFVVYPNPAVIPSRLHYLQNLQTEYLVFTYFTQKVLSKVSPETAAISLKSLQEGLYFYILETDGFQKRKK
jgi:hypothetical protein